MIALIVMGVIAAAALAGLAVYYRRQLGPTRPDRPIFPFGEDDWRQ